MNDNEGYSDGVNNTMKDVHKKRLNRGKIDYRHYGKEIG